MRKLPLLAVAGYAYKFLIEDTATILRLSWLPLLLVTIVQYFTMRAFYRALRTALETGSVASLSDTSAIWSIWGSAMPAWQLPGAVAVVIGTSIVAVALHRVILMGDRRPGLLVHFAFGKVEMLFVFLPIIGMAIAISGSMLLIGMIEALLGDKNPALNLVFILVWCALIFCVVRLAMIFPVTVIESRYDFRQAWALTRGNFWRLVGLGIVVFVPSLIVAGMVSYAFAPASGLAQLIETGSSGNQPSGVFDVIESNLVVQSIIGYLWSIVSGALGVAMLSYAYKALNGVGPDEVWTPDNKPRLIGT